MLKKFEDVEYVELLLNSVTRCVAIRPCEKDNPNAIRWGKLKNEQWCVSTVACRGLAKTLFDMLEWEEGIKYRFRGQYLGNGAEKMMLFELNEPEIMKTEEIILPPSEPERDDDTETEDTSEKRVKKVIYIFPHSWTNTFGRPVVDIVHVNMLEQNHYCGDWDVLRPAVEIEWCNVLTTEELGLLMQEAEKIMEDWLENE